jgi:uncharacterized protein YbaP (TraB family)
MNLRLRTCLLAGLALLFTSLSASADPALWRVRDADTTIYLFGTVHLLPGSTAWHDPTLDKALADSTTLYIELTDDDQVTMLALVMRYGMDTAHPLTSLLDEADAARLKTAADSAGISMQALGVMRPWMAALTLATVPLLKAGLDPEQGVDKQLKAQMSAAGKTVLGLETAEQQIHFLADMPQPLQLGFLRSTMRDIDKGPAELTRLVDAWKDGDVDTIARIEDEDLRQQDPQLYRRLLVERNQHWAAKIHELLQQPGTLFIAVGAGHLAGPDSVQQQLRQQGITVETVP